MYRLVGLAVFVAAVGCNDVIKGSNIGRKIYDEKIQASPAIWRQVQNVTVNTTDNEVVGRVVITDLRPEKDGEANIVEGGEGQKNVTVQLMSPTVFRGFDFKVEVYAVPDNQADSQPASETPVIENNGQSGQPPVPNVPVFITGDTAVNDDNQAGQQPDGDSVTLNPMDVSSVHNDAAITSKPIAVQNNAELGPVPAVNDQARQSRDTGYAINEDGTVDAIALPDNDHTLVLEVTPANPDDEVVVLVTTEEPEIESDEDDHDDEQEVPVLIAVEHQRESRNAQDNEITTEITLDATTFSDEGLSTTEVPEKLNEEVNAGENVPVVIGNDQVRQSRDTNSDNKANVTIVTPSPAESGDSQKSVPENKGPVLIGKDNSESQAKVAPETSLKDTNDKATPATEAPKINAGAVNGDGLTTQPTQDATKSPVFINGTPVQVNPQSYVPSNFQGFPNAQNIGTAPEKNLLPIPYNH